MLTLGFGTVLNGGAVRALFTAAGLLAVSGWLAFDGAVERGLWARWRLAEPFGFLVGVRVQVSHSVA